jgi:hypothetical protein
MSAQEMPVRHERRRWLIPTLVVSILIALAAVAALFVSRIR